MSTELVNPRYNPKVSVDAYRSSDRTAQRVLVEQHVRACGPMGCTPDEADAHFKCDPPKMWRRFGEMRRAGILILDPTGRTRPTRLGQQARVHLWVAPEKRVVPNQIRIGPKAYMQLRVVAEMVIETLDMKDREGFKVAIAALRAELRGESHDGK